MSNFMIETKWKELLDRINYFNFGAKSITMKMDEKYPVNSMPLPLEKFNKLQLKNYNYLYNDCKEKVSNIVKVIKSIEDINETDKIIIVLNNDEFFDRDSKELVFSLQENNINEVNIFNLSPISSLYTTKITIVRDTDMRDYPKIMTLEHLKDRDFKYKYNNVVHISAIKKGIISMYNSTILSITENLVYTIFSDNFNSIEYEVLFNGTIDHIARIVGKIDECIYSHYKVIERDKKTLYDLKNYILKLYAVGSSKKYEAVFESKTCFSIFNRNIRYEIYVDGLSNVTLKVFVIKLDNEAGNTKERNIQEELIKIQEQLITEYSILRKEKTQGTANLKSRSCIVDMIEKINRCIK